jgi:hypothetical protein
MADAGASGVDAPADGGLCLLPAVPAMDRGAPDVAGAGDQPADRPLELGIGPGEVPVSRTDIESFGPDLYEYISHLHIAVSGFIAAAGLATASLAWFGARRGIWWAYVTAVATPVLGLAVALLAHYPYHLDTLGHLGLIHLATAVFVARAALALRPLLATRNRLGWRQGMPARSGGSRSAGSGGIPVTGCQRIRKNGSGTVSVIAGDRCGEEDASAE